MPVFWGGPRCALWLCLFVCPLLSPCYAHPPLTPTHQVPNFTVCLGKDFARYEASVVAAMILKSGIRFEVLPHEEVFVNGPVAFYRDGLPVVVRIES